MAKLRMDNVVRLSAKGISGEDMEKDLRQLEEKGYIGDQSTYESLKELVENPTRIISWDIPISPKELLKRMEAERDKKGK